ncbi:MAG TPA: type VI secretion system tube protein Hcp [Polyangiaceae bacterium]
MSTGNLAMAYMKAKGSSQGAFLEDHSRAGKDRTLCLAVRFRGEVPHDVRGGKYATTRHEPISVVHEWGPATVQFMSALWSNETLDEVSFEFVRQDDGGKEEVYATLSLSKATVAYVELRSGDVARLVEGEHRALGEAGLLAEKVEFKLVGASGPMVATYDRSKS